jgi:hypothetical protein
MATHGLPTWPWTDTEIDSLPPPEALLLEAMRCWASAARRGIPPVLACKPPLVAEDAGDAARPLDAVLRAKGRSFAIAGLLSPRLKGDEPALLLGFSLSQRGPRREALAAFLRLLPPAQAYVALNHALVVGLVLRRAGLLLSQPLR